MTESALVIRETVTMALYITISLLAVLAAQPHGDRSVVGVLAIIWGTTLGLSLAHWLAFRLTARLFSGTALNRHERVTIAAQGAAALGVATLVSAPLLVAGADSALDLARLLLASLIGLFAFNVARRHGAGRGRAGVYAFVVVAIALAVAAAKNQLSGH
jgi:hypothetical protein